MPTDPTLSLCIATYRRAAYIEQTLLSILQDLPADVEVIVVDGASPDETATVVERLAETYGMLRYVREDRNSGVDQDYDKAVRYARGDYCWLMTDDDLLRSGAVAKVLAAIASGPELVVVNAEVRDAALETVLDARLLKFDGDRTYDSGDTDAFLREVGSYLSFIGGVVIRRTVWLTRSDGKFFGSLFAHVGVILSPPCVLPARVIAEPLVVIRYGNAMWTARGFEIWMFKWPELVWSFAGLGDAAKAAVTSREPWRSFRKLVLYRGTGGFSHAEYVTFLRARASMSWRLVCKAVALLPAAIANFVASVYCAFINRKARALMYDLARSRHSTWASRRLARGLLK